MIDLEQIRTIGDLPAVQARAWGARPAVIAGGETISYAQLHERAGRAAAVLAGLGIAPGQRVAWLGENHPGWFDTLFGARALGACFAPVNARLAPAEIAYVIEHSEAHAIVVTEAMLDTARTAIAGIAQPPQIVTTGFDLPGHARLDDPAADPTQAGGHHPGGDILQLYTSGTTGRPKGACMTDANYMAFLEHSQRIPGFDYDADDVVLIVVPLFHVAGFNVSLASLAHGSKVVVVSEFDAPAILALIAREKVTRTFLVPAMIDALLRADAGEDTASLRSISYGASPISDAVLTRAQARFGCDFIQFYGMTESAGGGSYLAAADHVAERLRSCGKPWSGMDMAVLGEDGQPLGTGEVGEIALKGPLIMGGYWRNPAATTDTVRAGWLHTGDVGYRDADGFYYVYDRLKDMIVSGGENVYPAEVENAIAGCPGVIDVAVIGVPSERWGEEVKAVIVPADPPPAPQDVIAWARERIAGYKVPKSVDFIAELPRNPSGKILRRVLRQGYWDGQDRAVG